MTEELDIIAISPETVFISGTSMTEQDVMNAVDTVLDNLDKLGAISSVDTAIDTLLSIQKFSGKALAKLLYGSQLWWKKSKPDKSYEDHMESKHGLKKVTIDRYITVWECITDESIPSDVAVRPMRELVPIAKTLSHGHSIPRKQWDRIVKATGLNEIQDILRGIKNKAPRKSSMQIYFKRDGSLEMWKDNKKTFLGWLDKEAYEKNEDAKKAIDRILDSAGIIRK